MLWYHGPGQHSEIQPVWQAEQQAAGIQGGKLSGIVDGHVRDAVCTGRNLGNFRWNGSQKLMGTGISANGCVKVACNVLHQGGDV